MNIDKESSFLSILLFKEKFVYEKRRFLQRQLETFRINTLQLHLHAQNKKRRTQRHINYYACLILSSSMRSAVTPQQTLLMIR
jgi:hypothetical protein